ncbi:MAG: LacI family DNA-binding transcriptional regulator [Planctomycetota bacterium]
MAERSDQQSQEPEGVPNGAVDSVPAESRTEANGAASNGGSSAPNGRRGSRRRKAPTVRDLAESLDLSVGTVSRVLNNHPEVSDETRRRVIDAAKSMGYASNVGKRATNLLALLLGEEQFSDFGSFHAAIMSGVLKAAGEHNFDVTIVDPRREKHPVESYRAFFHRRGITGAILRGADATLVATELAAEDFPAVMIANRSDDPAVSFVDADSRATSRQAVEHLLALGHKRIGLGTHVVNDVDHADRCAGYEAALRGAGIEPEDRYIVRTPNDQRGGVLMLERLLALPEPPTAIYFTDPMPTIGALIRCAELGIAVPADLSVVGFDDSDVRYRTFPTFTAVAQDASGLAVQATRWLIQKVQGRSTGPFRLFLDSSFHVEASTALPSSDPVRVEAGGVIRVGD